MSSELNTYTKTMLPALESEMRSILRANGTPPDALYGMMQYHMGWLDAEFKPAQTNSGKRIRPLLCLLTAQAAGGNWQQALPAAASVELLHNFSLIHDDIEDGSETRRGRLTMWKVWGAAQAINSGDAMFAVAHLALNRLIERDVPAASIVQALRRFDVTCVELTQGQYADMDFETRDTVSVEEYIDMITGKTAVLLAHCAELGALVAGQDAASIEHYAAFGRNLGLAFQVIDDILGIWGDEIKIGKSAASDIITKKKTLPVLYGLNQSQQLQELYLHVEPDTQFVKEVVATLDELSTRDFAIQYAKGYSNKALEHLNAAQPQGDAGQALHQLADMLLNRDY